MCGDRDDVVTGGIHLPNAALELAIARQNLSLLRCCGT